MEFAHLKTYTHYSMLEWIWTPKEYAEFANSLKLKHLAITDIDGVYGAIEFYTACKKNNITPLIGTTLSYVPNVKLKKKNEDYNYVTFLSISNQGYHNMLELISWAHIWSRHDRARFDFDILGEYSKDIYMLMWGLHSPIMSMIEHKQRFTDIVAFLKRFESVMEEKNCLLWLLTQNEENKSIKMHNQLIIKLSKELWRKIVLLTEVLYVSHNDKDLYDVWLSVKDWKRVFDEDRRKTIGDHHLMTYDEVNIIMKKNNYTNKDVTQRITNTNNVAQSCQVEISLWWVLFPRYTNPEKISKLFEEHKNNLITK